MSPTDNTPRARRPLLRFLLVSVMLAGLAALLWRPLVAWFAGPDAGHTQVTQRHAAAGPTPHPLPPATLEYARAALETAEGLRAQLAADTLDGVPARAAELGTALGEGARALGTTGPVHAFQDGARAAERLARATTLAEARAAYADVSRVLVTVAAADPRLQEGWRVFECPMVKGYNRWVQRAEKMANPYMGQRMLACGTKTDFETAAVSAASTPGAHAADSSEVAHYTCPMHPSVKQAGPGQCPLCGMDLTPVTKADLASGVIHIDDARRQRIGVKTGRVSRAPMDLSFQALGRVTYDERALTDVTLKLDGFVQELHVDATGEPVKKGQPLFTLYSAELYAAQQEYLLALKSQAEAQALGHGERTNGLVRAARRRLELWDLTEAQVRRIAQAGEPQKAVPFLAPVSGYVLEKNLVAGAAVRAGERLYRIAPLDRVWVEADVYEQDLPRVKVGQAVSVTLPYLPGRSFRGKVAYIYPALEKGTRTGRIRVELPNPDLALKPDMFADVRFQLTGGERLQVPEGAVVYTGPRRLVFVDEGEGRLRPQEVRLGIKGEGTYEVLEGLEEGDVVVTSGNFLVAAESRLRSAADAFGGGESTEGGDHAGH